MKTWIMVLRAADAAARRHMHQWRKGAAKDPYINHLLEVATLVAEATDGKDLDLVIAALLHDAIEDCEVPPEFIAPPGSGFDREAASRRSRVRPILRLGAGGIERRSNPCADRGDLHPCPRSATCRWDAARIEGLVNLARRGHALTHGTPGWPRPSRERLPIRDSKDR
jgi:HD domain